MRAQSSAYRFQPVVALFFEVPYVVVEPDRLEPFVQLPIRPWCDVDVCGIDGIRAFSCAR
jgi:hypothetical protein